MAGNGLQINAVAYANIKEQIQMVGVGRPLQVDVLAIAFNLLLYVLWRWSGKVQRLPAVTIAGVRNVELQPPPLAYNYALNHSPPSKRQQTFTNE